jgi:hypothetical protein
MGRGKISNVKKFFVSSLHKQQFHLQSWYSRNIMLVMKFDSNSDSGQVKRVDLKIRFANFIYIPYWDCHVNVSKSKRVEWSA